MNNMKDRRLRRTLIQMIAVMCAAIAAVFFVAHYATVKIQQQNAQRNAQIVAVVSEKYDLSQEEVIELLQQDSFELSEQGEEILAMYGMDYNDNSLIGSYKQIEFMLISVFLVLMVLFCIALFLLNYWYLLGLDHAIGNISEYINRLLNKDYDLDIIDNDEGSLSSLKNDIYKVTVMMKEQNEVLKQDKMYLANNLADISHQLKTPLTSMLIMSDLLENDDLSLEERRKFLGVIKSQLHRIEWLVSSLLKMAKLDAKTIVFKKERIRAHQFLNKAIEPILMLMEEKQQQFIIEGDNPIMCFDINWTSEAFVNILKNCSEHTQAGGTLRAEVFDTAMYTEFILSDNGEGIDAKDLPFIFERFYRASKSNSDSVGIGLAMAYSIITSQEGTISVRSKLNEGTAFSVRFFK